MDTDKKSESSEASMSPAKSSDEEEEDKSSIKDQSDADSDDIHQMKLRSGKSQRTYTFRNEQRKQRATRGRKMHQGRRRRTVAPRGKKKVRTSGDLRGEWSGQKSDTESEASQDPPEEAETPVVQKFLYKPGVPWPDLSPYMQQLIEIRIASEYLTFKSNYAVKNVVWGNDVYTSDSDLVAALQHAGLIDLNDGLSDQYEGLSAFVRVTKGRSNYASSLRNGVKSRKCVNYEGHSLKPEKVSYLSCLGKLEELTEFASRMPSEFPKERPKPNFNIKTSRLIPKTSVIFNLSLEAAHPFSLDNFADKGLDESTFLSNKLKKSVLYLETASKRYELSQENEENEEQIFDQSRYRWAEVSSPVLFKDCEFMFEKGSPLENKWLGEVEDDLQWQNLEWTSTGLYVKGALYGPFRCFFYYPL